jgi:uncharacterized protein
VTIAWQGGEPMLMELEFFRRAEELAKRHAPPGMTVRHTIQTNGTKINDDWAHFFKDNDVLVGLSVDGPRELHDSCGGTSRSSAWASSRLAGAAPLRPGQA